MISRSIENTVARILVYQRHSIHKLLIATHFRDKSRSKMHSKSEQHTKVHLLTPTKSQ